MHLLTQTGKRWRGEKHVIIIFFSKKEEVTIDEYIHRSHMLCVILFLLVAIPHHSFLIFLSSSSASLDDGKRQEKGKEIRFWLRASARSFSDYTLNKNTHKNKIQRKKGRKKNIPYSVFCAWVFHSACVDAPGLVRKRKRSFLLRFVYFLLRTFRCVFVIFRRISSFLMRASLGTRKAYI